MSFRVELAVLSEQKQFCRFGLTIHNLTDRDLLDWKLQFIVDRFILPDSFTHGDIQQVGSFCSITPDTHIIEANKHYYCEFSIGCAPLRFYTDGLKDAIIIANNGAQKHPVILTPIVLASPYRDRSTLPQTELQTPSLIPKPNRIERLEGEFELNHSSQITLQANLAEKAATWLQLELARLYNFQAQTIGQSNIVFRTNPTLDEGEYHLIVSRSGVRLEAGSRVGFVHASAHCCNSFNLKSMAD